MIKKKIYWKRIFHLIFFLVFFVFCVYFFCFSSFFSIKKIEIKRPNALIESWAIESEILEAANFKMKSNLFLQNLNKKEKLLKEKFYRFNNVYIKRCLPNTLIVTINEKQPIIIALKENGEYLLLGLKGEVLDVVNKIEKFQIPVFSSYIFPKNIKNGDILVESSLIKSIEFLKCIPNEYKYLITEIVFQKGIISIYSSFSNVKIILGDTSDLNKKLKVLKILINETKLLNKSIEYIDLSIVEKPTIK